MLGAAQFFTADIFFGSQLMPSFETTCPRKATQVLNSLHFEGFSNNPALSILSKTQSKFSIASLKVRLNTMTSSKYTRHRSNVSPLRTSSIRRSKVAGAVAKPKGMTLNLCRPFLVLKAVLSLSSSATGICQYPLARSRVLNSLLPASASRQSSILGRGKASFRVTSLKIHAHPRSTVLLCH